VLLLLLLLLLPLLLLLGLTLSRYRTTTGSETTMKALGPNSSLYTPPDSMNLHGDTRYTYRTRSQSVSQASRHGSQQRLVDPVHQIMTHTSKQVCISAVLLPQLPVPVLCCFTYHS
jgi:hypothetical protein